MARSSTRRTSPVAARLAAAGLVLTLLSPLTVFVAVVGLKLGAWPIGMAYDTLTMTVAAVLAGLGVLGALIALIAGGMNRSWIMVLAAIVVSVVTVALFMRELSAESASEAPGATTDPGEPLGFSNAIMAERRADGADPVSAQDGSCSIAHLPTQSAPGAAGYALQEAGFVIRDLGVNRGSGVYVSPFFDRTYDAAIRIRPGRTDVRVYPRDGAHDHGASCRLATKIVEALQPSL